MGEAVMAVMNFVWWILLAALALVIASTDKESSTTTWVGGAVIATALFDLSLALERHWLWVIMFAILAIVGFSRLFATERATGEGGM